MPSDPNVSIETTVAACTCEPDGEVVKCPHFTTDPGVDCDCLACSWRKYDPDNLIVPPGQEDTDDQH